NGKLARPRGTCRFKDVVRVELNHGNLRFVATPTPSMQKMLSGQSVLLSIEESPDPWIVSLHPLIGSGTYPNHWLLNAAAQCSQQGDAKLRPIGINSAPGNYSVIGEGRVGGRTMHVEFCLAESQPVRIILVDRAADLKPEMFSAQN